MQLTEQKEIDTVWQNDNEPMTSFTAPGVSAADGTPFAGKVGELYAPSRDQEKAKEYLATALSELGCTVDDLSAHLSIDCGDSATAIAEASFYQEQWRQVLGIEVTVNSMITKQGSQNRKTATMSCPSPVGAGLSTTRTPSLTCGSRWRQQPDRLLQREIR